MTIPQNPIEALSNLIRSSGPVPAVRVSPAGVRRWVPVRFGIGLNSRGCVVALPAVRAAADCPSRAAALAVADALAAAEGWVVCLSFGHLTAGDCADVLEQIGSVDISGLG